MDKTVREARRLYLEQYGSTRVMVSYLQVALFCAAVGLVASLGLSDVCLGKKSKTTRGSDR